MLTAPPCENFETVAPARIPRVDSPPQKENLQHSCHPNTWPPIIHVRPCPCSYLNQPNTPVTGGAVRQHRDPGKLMNTSKERVDSPLRKMPGFSVSRYFAIAAVLAFLMVQIQSTAAQSRMALSNATALYARVIRLAHSAIPQKNGTLVVSVTAFPGGSGEEDIYASPDGNSFTQIGAIHDPDFAGGLCCGTLFELSSQIGKLAPGTLLWAGSVGQSSTTQPMRIKIYQSADGGATWSYLSNCATASGVRSAVGGLWEPEFTVASDGGLVCFYSDETQAGHSQLIHQDRSYDGINWQDSTYTIASSISSDRPGMPVVTILPGGTYFMSYELCGSAACAVYSRTSADGWNWGDPTNMGTRVVTAAGQWLEHAPYNTWAPSATSPNGTILVIGQMMYDSSGSVSKGNGITIFTNHTADGSGTWGTMPAPVQVPAAYNNYCPNYSSPLLPSADGSNLLEFASDYVGSICTMFYGSGPILAGVAASTVTVTPASSTVTGYPLQVTVNVAGNGTLPTPTGTVTLSLGTYSATQMLTNGSASFSIPGPLDSGAATLTAAYSGDSNYSSASGTASITVNVPSPGFAVGATAVSVTPGAVTGNTSTVTVTPSGGFTGKVALSAAVVASPANAVAPPTFSFGATSPVNITGAGSGTATLTVSTTAPVSAALAPPALPTSLPRTPAMLAWAGLLLVGIPGRRSFRRRLRLCRSLAALCFCAGVACAGLAGCGGSPGSTRSVAGTTPGNYLVQITGTSGSITATGEFTLSVQ